MHLREELLLPRMELVSLTNSQQLKKLPPLTNLPGQIARIKDDNIGGKYTLANNAIVHSVPPRNTLKGALEQTGIIDSWPAHSTNQRPSNMQLALTKNNDLIISNLQAEGKPEVTPKPKFLENLEKFLQRELKALGCTDSNSASSETRLQAYRETFEYLLEEFKTYKPILSAIKNEYEMMLASQNQKIRELEPLKQMLVTLADQCDYKLMQYREEEKLEIKQLREEKRGLMDVVTQLKNEKHALHIQVDKLCAELAQEHEKFRNEQDKKKLLIMDLNDLRFQQEEAKLAELKREKKRMLEGQAVQDDGSNDDPVTLKIALRVCRQNLNDAMKRLTKLEADYGDVIPRREYVELETKYNQLVKDYDTEMKDTTKIKTDFATLKENCKILESKFQETSQELERVKANSTPRPDWDRVTSLVNEEKWKDLSNNKSSIQLLDTLLNEMSGKKHSSSASDFNLGLGLDSSNPPHLRFEGKLKNVKIKKADLCNLIADIWKEREKGSNRSIDMSEFLIKFLKKRFSSEQTAFEYSYLLSDAFEKNNFLNEYIEQFTAIINNKIDEEVYFSEQRALKRIHEQLQKESEKEDSEDGSVSKNTFRDVLKNAFKYNKNLDQIDYLIKMAEDELDLSDSSRVEFKYLFNDDSKGGVFMNAMRSSFKLDRMSLANKIADALGLKGPFTPSDLKKAINTVDQSISDKDVESITHWCFKNNEKSIEVDVMTSRLETCGFS